MNTLRYAHISGSVLMVAMLSVGVAQAVEGTKSAASTFKEKVTSQVTDSKNTDKKTQTTSKKTQQKSTVQKGAGNKAALATTSAKSSLDAKQSTVTPVKTVTTSEQVETEVTCKRSACKNYCNTLLAWFKLKQVMIPTALLGAGIAGFVLYKYGFFKMCQDSFVRCKTACKNRWNEFASKIDNEDVVTAR